MKIKYELSFLIGGSHVILLDYVNAQRLQSIAPDFWKRLIAIENFNKQNVYPFGHYTSVNLRQMIMGKVLNKNCYYFLSCGGALPVHDSNFNIPLNPNIKTEFDSLKLDKYITFYTDIVENQEPKVKTYPIRYWIEYISIMKKHYPQIEIIQCGGSSDVKVVNADRHYLGCDLELTKYILANSLLHVGGEGGLIHLATYLGTKCLVLFGSTCREYVGYDQNINIVSDICFPCMYILQNESICVRGYKNPPPCMLNHTPRIVYEQTSSYLNKILLN